MRNQFVKTIKTTTARELRNLKKQMTRLVIEQASFVIKTRKRQMKKAEYVTLNCLTAYKEKGSKETKMVASISRMEENEAVRAILKSVDKYNARYGNSSFEVSNFTKDFILLDFAADSSIASGMTELYVFWNGKRTKFTILVDGEYIDVMTNQPVKPVGVVGPRKYAIIGGSPSSLRKTQTLAFDVSMGFDKIDAMLDYLTDGAYSKAFGKKVSAEQLSKYITRFFSWTAPNKIFGNMEHAAIFFGTWKDKALDGAGFIDDVYYARCVENMLGNIMTVSPASVKGMSVQCRPFSAKVNAIVTSVLGVIKLYDAAMANVVYINPKTMSDADERNLDLAFEGKGIYAGKTVIFGEEGCEADFISDLNGYKTSFNWRLEGKLRVLDIAKSGDAHTSIQIWEVLMDKDPMAATELMKTLREEEFGGVFKSLFLDREVAVPSYIECIKNLYAQSVIKSVAPDYVLDKDMAMFKKVVEELITRIKNADDKFKYLVDGEYARIISDLAILCSETGIIQYGEGFCPAANAYFADGANTIKIWDNKEARVQFGKRIVSMFKYPKMGRKEFYKFTALTLERVIERINALPIAQEQKAILIDFFGTLKPGCVVVPAIELLKQQCAGLDFDYDGATLVFDARFNALLPEEISITNIVLKEKQEVKAAAPKTGIAGIVNKANLNRDYRATLCAEEMHKSFLTYVQSNTDGWSVGSITNTNATQLAVLQLAQSTNHPYYFNLMREMLGKWFGNEQGLANGGTQAYVGLDKTTTELSNMDAKYACFDKVEKDSTGTMATVVNVSESAVKRVVAEMEMADWSNESNLLHIFQDLNEIFRFYQEITIDSAKTGKQVVISIAPGRKYHAAMINDNKVVYNWDYALENCSIKVEVNAEPPSESKTVVKDRLFKVREKYFAPDLEATAEAIFSNKELKLNIDDIEKLAAKFNNAVYADHNRAMFKLKSIYGDLTANYIKNTEAAGDNEEARKFAADAYKAELANLAAMGRALTPKMSLAGRGCYAKFISAFIMGKNGAITVAQNGGNNFASKVFPQEYISFVVKNYGQIDFCGEALIKNDIYEAGETVTFTNGVDETGLVYTAADITGEFVIKEFNGKFYATQNLVDVITLPELEDKVTVRISDTKDMEVVAESLKENMHVTLRAYADTTTKEFGIFNAAGEKVCGIDTESRVLNALYDGKKGVVENIIDDVTTMPNGATKRFLLVVVKVK